MKVLLSLLALFAVACASGAIGGQANGLGDGHGGNFNGKNPTAAASQQSIRVSHENNGGPQGSKNIADPKSNGNNAPLQPQLIEFLKVIHEVPPPPPEIKNIQVIRHPPRPPPVLKTFQYLHQPPPPPPQIKTLKVVRPVGHAALKGLAHSASDQSAPKFKAVAVAQGNPPQLKSIQVHAVAKGVPEVKTVLQGQKSLKLHLVPRQQLSEFKTVVHGSQPTLHEGRTVVQPGYAPEYKTVQYYPGSAHHLTAAQLNPLQAPLASAPPPPPPPPPPPAQAHYVHSSPQQIQYAHPGPQPYQYVHSGPPPLTYAPGPEPAQPVPLLHASQPQLQYLQPPPQPVNFVQAGPPPVPVYPPPPPPPPPPAVYPAPQPALPPPQPVVAQPPPLVHAPQHIQFYHTAPAAVPLVPIQQQVPLIHAAPQHVPLIHHVPQPYPIAAEPVPIQPGPQPVHLIESAPQHLHFIHPIHHHQPELVHHDGPHPAHELKNIEIIHGHPPPHFHMTHLTAPGGEPRAIHVEQPSEVKTLNYIQYIGAQHGRR